MSSGLVIHLNPVGSAGSRGRRIRRWNATWNSRRWWSRGCRRPVPGGPSTIPAGRPSPRNMRKPSAVGIPTAHRSASGSLAMIRSAFSRTAAASARSIAPGSSGFGNATVGNAGSGSNCSATGTDPRNQPFADRLEQVPPHRAWRYTTVSWASPVFAGSARPTTRARYSSTISFVEPGPSRGSGCPGSGAARRSGPRSRRRREARSAYRRRGRPCNPLSSAGCGSRSRRPGVGSRALDGVRGTGVGSGRGRTSGGQAGTCGDGGGQLREGVGIAARVVADDDLAASGVL